MTELRIEKDALGEMEIPLKTLYGIHTQRAINNFPIAQRPVNRTLIHTYGAVKLACATTNFNLGYFEKDKFKSIEEACNEMMTGTLDKHIVVDALQGGAGTSTNMNINEVIANRALQLMGYPIGSYDKIHPIEDINMHQSTNDTFPTAMKVAAIYKIRNLEKVLVKLLEEFQKKEKKFGDIVKVGRTQMQDAVLTTMGRTMSAFAEAISRDRWRIYKCEERLRVVNLGGTAIGTGITAPRKYIFNVVEELKKVTGIGFARGENLVDTTQNNDLFVEVSGILNACASNLLKIAGDIRLMSSGPDAGLKEINIPECQTGSSIMPGKVNPVIPEAVTQAALVVISNNNTISQACSMGSLELNPFLPLVADKLLESLDLLLNAVKVFNKKCIKGVTVNRERCEELVDGAAATLTALIEKIGYKMAEQIGKESSETGKSIKESVLEKELVTNEEYEQLISAESVMSLGHRNKLKVES